MDNPQESLTAAPSRETPGADEPDDELAPCYELQTLEELRALADPLRMAIVRLLKEKERTVKELCDLLGESSTRLYYHVGELERLGVIRLVRTEARAGIVQKYYRSVAHWLRVPFPLLHTDPESAEARAGVEWHARLFENAAMEVRYVLSEHIDDLDPDTTYFIRSFVRTTPERARAFVERLDALAEELVASDDEENTFRVTFTSGFLPMPRFVFRDDQRVSGEVIQELRSGEGGSAPVE